MDVETARAAVLTLTREYARIYKDRAAALAMKINGVTSQDVLAAGAAHEQAVDELILAVKAEMPCDPMWGRERGERDLPRRCPDIGLCPSCEARQAIESTARRGA